MTVNDAQPVIVVLCIYVNFSYPELVLTTYRISFVHICFDWVWRHHLVARALRLNFGKVEYFHSPWLRNLYG